MFLPHSSKFTASIVDKTQADGAQIVDVESAHYLGRWEFQFDLPVTPIAGTARVSVKMPGAETWADLDPIVNLVTGPYVVYFTATVEAIRVTPSNLDADKTYSAIIVGS